MTIQEAIAATLDRQDLSGDQIEAVFTSIMGGEATPAQIGGLLVGLRAKGECVTEIVGAARAMRAHGRSITPQRTHLVDTCGTGGDRGHTFNVSTAAAIVAAAAGIGIAKHGNRAMSGKVGGADVLELLGVRIDLEPEAVQHCIDTVGIGFLFAQVFHPAMRHAAGPRRELGVRTIFNLLGPLCNPAAVRRQVVGLFAPEWIRPMAEALMQLGAEHALVVHGAAGIDEISLCGPTQVAEIRDGRLTTFVLTPEEFGFAPCDVEELRIASPEDSASRIRAILDGARGPATDVVLLNAAAAIYVGGAAESIAAAISVARAAIQDGRARATLAAWVEATR